MPQMCNKEALHLVSIERAKMIDRGLGLDYKDWKGMIADKKEALSKPNRMGKFYYVKVCPKIKLTSR